jgi:peptide/nickel transport system substrate-binding protein
MTKHDGELTPFDAQLAAYFQQLRQQAISRRGLFRTAAAASAAVLTTRGAHFLPGLSVLAADATTVTYALEGDVRGLEPALAYDFTANPVACQISEGLLMFDEKGGVQPLLAASIDHPDPATYIVKLKQGLHFQDGSPVTIDDVVASIARVRDPNVAGPLAWMYDNPKAAVTRTDDQTITIKLGTPSSLFQYVLATTAGHVIPKAAIDKYGADLLRNPIGTGPYKFVKWDAGSEIVLEKNPNYWQAGMPYYDQLVFKIVPEGTTRITGLKNGDVNAMTAVPPDQIDTVKGFPNVDWHEVVGYTINYLAMRNDKPPLNDVKVRKAIAQAIDLNSIMTNIVKGEGILSHNTSVPPNMPGSATDQLQPPTYNVAAAKQLLAQSSQPNGFKTQLHTIAPNDIYVPQALAVQQALKALNIDVEVKQYAYADYITLIQGGDYEGMLILQWGADFPDALANLLPMFLSTNVPPLNNSSFYKNPQVDQLLTGADQELDLEKRKQMLIDAQKLISDDQPFVWLEHFKWFMPFTKGITGYSITPLWYYDCWGRSIKPATA